MGNRIAALAVVVVVGVLIGVGVVMKQAKEPLMRQMLQQQSEILKNQNNMAEKLSGRDSDDEGDDDSDLEQRVVTLENQVKALIAILKDAQGGDRQAQGPQEDFTKVYEIPVEHSYILGNVDAPVTIVAFDDIQCPFCARFHGPLLEVLKAYPTQVKLMIKNFPLGFHPRAKPAAKAALAAGEQGKYWDMANALLANNSDLSEDRFKEEAKKIGLDVDKFMKDYSEKDAQWEDIINKDMELGAKVNVMGTPTFFINGRKTMARDLDSYKKEIDEILKGK